MPPASRRGCICEVGLFGGRGYASFYPEKLEKWVCPMTLARKTHEQGNPLLPKDAEAEKETAHN